jgi:hypothetical protein
LTRGFLYGIISLPCKLSLKICSNYGMN